MYHGICDEYFDLLKGYDDRHISKSLFRKQLEYLKLRGYKFVNMTQLVNAIKNKTGIGKFVVLTFDDGFKNVVENAYPVMKEFGAKGCIYLVSNLVGTDKLLWTDCVETVIRNQNQGEFQFNFKGEIISYKLNGRKSREFAMKDIKMKLRTLPDKDRREHLKPFHALIHQKDIPAEFMLADWEQIKGLDPEILEIGGHTRRHPNCTNLVTDIELEDELFNSKKDIERNIGRSVEHFCYPAGSYNDKVISAVRKHGYTSAVTIDNGFNDENTDLFKLKRIEAKDLLLYFKASVSGSTGFLRRLKKFRGRVGYKLGGELRCPE